MDCKTINHSDVCKPNIVGCCVSLFFKIAFKCNLQEFSSKMNVSGSKQNGFLSTNRVLKDLYTVLRNGVVSNYPNLPFFG